MSKATAWMPLYIGDYFSDTMHLNAAGHGAYLLLLMHEWRTGPLPVDDKSLASIARTDLRAWLSDVGPVVRSFFTMQDGRLIQMRLEAERERAAAVVEKRRAAGRASGKARSSQHVLNTCSADVGTTLEQSPRQSQSQEASVLRTAADAPEEPDARTAVFREGLEIVRRLSGKPDGPARSLLGRWLMVARDDCAVLLDILRKAEAARLADPVAWIVKALEARAAAPAADDPWGIRAWMRRQPDLVDAGTPKASLNGNAIEACAQLIAEAAGLPASWRGNWDTLGAWFRDGLSLTPSILEAIRRQAGRTNEPVRSIAFFDQTVRSAAACRRAA